MLLGTRYENKSLGWAKGFLLLPVVVKGCESVIRSLLSPQALFQGASRSAVEVRCVPVACCDLDAALIQRPVICRPAASSSCSWERSAASRRCRSQNK